MTMRYNALQNFGLSVRNGGSGARNKHTHDQKRRGRLDVGYCDYYYSRRARSGAAISIENLDPVNPKCSCSLKGQHEKLDASVVAVAMPKPCLVVVFARESKGRTARASASERARKRETWNARERETRHRESKWTQGSWTQGLSDLSTTRIHTLPLTNALMRARQGKRRRG